MPGAAWSVFTILLEPLIVGSHAASYTAAAAAMVAGQDPWVVGPPLAIFGGPPTMLLPYVPFIGLPEIVTRLAWVIGDLAIAAWALRRLKLPLFWLLFPPLFQTIVLGHPEVLVLGFLVLRNPVGGLAVLVKPYAVFPLLAERRWLAIALGTAAGAATLLVLPWGRFLAELPEIGATLARQAHPDGVFGDPLLMGIALVALACLGLRRALWLAVPLLWPYAQLNYRTMTIPMLSPIIAISWALPIPGATLLGVVLEAALLTVDRWRRLPAWLREGTSIRAEVPEAPRSMRFGRSPLAAEA